MDKKLLEVKDLHVVYHTDDADVYALNGVTLSVDEGETLGLVGETGAGKTTTALSIMHLLPHRIGEITQGEITLNDLAVLSADKNELRNMRGDTVSMIFQDPMTSLNPVITVGDQIAEVLKLHNKAATKQELGDKVDEMMEMVGLPASRKGEYPHQFSGGMKQRIVIAMALACSPKLLLADEPTTALDVTIQAQVLEIMKDLKNKLKTAMILITHDLGIVAETCDKVAIMYAGEVIEHGTVEDIFENEEHHPYTVGLFGSIPSLDKEEDRLHPIPGLMPDPTNLPAGCPFSPRCPHCMEICTQQKPQEYLNGSHAIKCHLFDGKANA